MKRFLTFLFVCMILTAGLAAQEGIANEHSENGGGNIFRERQAAFIAGAWIFAIVIAFLTIRAWKKTMNTAVAQKSACTYVIPGSFSVNVKKDRFLYSTVTKTKRQTQSSSGGRGRR